MAANSYVRAQIDICILLFKNLCTSLKAGYTKPDLCVYAAPFVNQYDRMRLWLHDVQARDGTLDKKLNFSTSLRQCLLELLGELSQNLSIVPLESTIEAMLNDVTDIVDNMISLEPALRSPAPIDRSINGHSGAGISTSNKTEESVGRNLEHPVTFQCKLCTQRFTRAYNLRSHLRLHISGGP
jgi:hypothetical protein